MNAKFSDSQKEEFIYDEQMRKKLKISSSCLTNIIASMESNSIEKFLDDRERNSPLSLRGVDVVRIINKVKDESKRLEYAESYKLHFGFIADIVKDFSNNMKKEVLLSERYDFGSYQISRILSQSDDMNFIIEFINENPKFLQDHEISIYKIVQKFNKEKKLEFINRLDEINCEQHEKLKAVAVLSAEEKEQISKDVNMQQKYKSALDMECDEFEHLIVDLNCTDFTKYIDFQELIYIKPQDIQFDQHDKLIELAKICPKIKFVDDINMSASTAQEFLDGEKWISEILSNIRDDWSDIQKIAYIDHAIGKRISYTPDFDTEVCNLEDARALWKIISKGYGVCNGISQVEQYILKHIGIESEMVSSGRHNFLRLKNIEIAREDGTKSVGDTFLDPTWNLAEHRYDAYPNFFLVDYDELQKQDSTGAHKIKGEVVGETIGMEESVLRQTFRSIGLAKEDGTFPISDMSNEIDKIANKPISTTGENTKKVAEMLGVMAKHHPDFSICINSTMNVLCGLIFSKHDLKEGVGEGRVVIDRVYRKDDSNQLPVLYVYYTPDDTKSEGSFFVAERGDRNFTQMAVYEFENGYAVYEADYIKNGQKNPWEPEKAVQTLKAPVKESKKIEGSAR